MDIAGEASSRLETLTELAASSKSAVEQINQQIGSQVASSESVVNSLQTVVESVQQGAESTLSSSHLARDLINSLNK